MRLWAVLLVMFSSPAAADEYLAFQSPTGNIHCGLHAWEGQASVRCDLLQLVPSYTRPPPGCEFDWGRSFGLDSRGKGYLACVSDAVADPANPVLRYGQAVSLGGISCVSAQTGMTCTNAEGHGFSVAKAKQKLY